MFLSAILPVYDREEYYGYYYGLKSRLVRFCKALMTDDFDPVTFDADKPSKEQLQLFVGRYRHYSNPTGGQYVDIELQPRRIPDRDQVVQRPEGGPDPDIAPYLRVYISRARTRRARSMILS